MKTKHFDIIRGWSDRRKEHFIAVVTSLQGENEYGVNTVDVIRSFDNYTLFPLDVKKISKNFGSMDKKTFRAKYPEYII